MAKAYQERHENQTDADTNEDGADPWNIPWDAGVLACPPQPKYANNETRAANHGTEQTFFWRWKTFPLLYQCRIMGGRPDVDK